jgi:hypothetical protein
MAGALFDHTDLTSILVIPAKAGIQGNPPGQENMALGPRFREGDEREKV